MVAHQAFLWVALFVVVVLVIAWPHVRQALIDYRNQIVYPAPRIPGTLHPPRRSTLNEDEGCRRWRETRRPDARFPRVHPTEADNEEGLRLARLAQQERLKEASKEAKEQEKLKPKKKPQKLRPNSTRPSSSAAKEVDVFV